MESIFNRVLRGEDSYSQLICNLLNRDTAFRRVFLESLDVRDTPDLVSRRRIRTQAYLAEGCGRADLLIETNESTSIIEVKTDSRRGQTNAQSLKEVNTYASYLKRLKEREPHQTCSLIFLVPESWKFVAGKSAEIEVYMKKVDNLLRGNGKGIAVSLKSWQQVAEAMEKSSESDFCVVNEFSQLLQEQYRRIVMGENEWIALRNDTVSMSTLLKVLKLIEEVHQKKEQWSSKSRKKTFTPEVYADEFGFYILTGDDTSFWFGIKKPRREGDAQVSSSPLCLGITTQSEQHKRKFLDAVKEIYGSRVEADGEYDYAPMPAVAKRYPVTADELWKDIKTIVEAVS